MPQADYVTVRQCVRHCSTTTAAVSVRVNNPFPESSVGYDCETRYYNISQPISDESVKARTARQCMGIYMPTIGGTSTMPKVRVQNPKLFSLFVSRTEKSWCHHWSVVPPSTKIADAADAESARTKRGSLSYGRPMYRGTEFRPLSSSAEPDVTSGG